MRISEYSLLDSSYGNGYIDDPYEFYSLYVRGGADVSWTVEGKGKFSLNLTDMYQRVYEQDSAYHAISIFVNGELIQSDNSFLEETEDYGVTVELTEDVSEVKLQFSSSLNKIGNLTYIRKLSSFLLEKKPVSEETSTTTTLEPVLSEENRIKADGMRIASVDLDSSCGPHSIVVTPDTGDFHYIDGELWFDGNKSIEREWRVCVKAIDTAGDIIGGKCFTFTIADCDSSGACVIVDDPSNPGGPGGPSRPGGPGTGNPDIDDPDVDPEIPAPTGGVSVFNSCGPRVDDDSGAIFSNWTLSWPSSSVDQLLYDFQLSKGNTFNLIDLQYLAITASELDVLVDDGVTYFFRIRARTPDSSRVSEWSDEFMFESSSPNPSDPCGITQEEPEPPEQAPVICRDGIPTDPNEPGTNPNPNPNPSPNPSPTDPTDPGGPGQCFGNGCGDDDDPNNPNNPNGPNNPNPPGRFPTNPRDPGGCIGPGCSPGSGPGGDGETPGNEPGPGGPTNPNPQDPTMPRPTAPTCFDGELRKSVINVKNESANVINILVKYSINKSDTCTDYLQSIGKTNQETLKEESIAAGQSKTIDLKYVCPECVDICGTSSAGGDPYTWAIVSSEIDSDGNESQPEVWKSTSENTGTSCDCLNTALVDVFHAQQYNQGGIAEQVSMSPISPNWQFAIKRPLNSGNEGCFIVVQTQVEQATGYYQQRSKLVCFECGGDSEWIETTPSVIGCETGFFRRFSDPNDGIMFPDTVSYPNHWKMSSLTHEYGRQTWPETNVRPWNIASEPFRSTWELENDLCVTCCETDVSPTGFTYITGNVVEGDYGSGPNNPNLPFNNILCTNGMIDFNMGGRTGSERTLVSSQQKDRTYVSPCSPGVNSFSNLQDGLNSVANSFYAQRQQFGFSQVTLAEVNAMRTATACSTNNDPSGDESACTKVATNGDFTYGRSSYTRYQACQYDGSGDNRGVYGYVSQGLNVSQGVVVTYLAGISADCNRPDSSIGYGRFRQKGIPPNSIPGQYQVPAGINYTENNLWWSETGFRLDPGQMGPDQRTWNSGRFSIDIAISAYMSGDGSNPLP